MRAHHSGVNQKALMPRSDQEEGGGTEGFICQQYMNISRSMGTRRYLPYAVEWRSRDDCAHARALSHKCMCTDMGMHAYIHGIRQVPPPRWLGSEETVCRDAGFVQCLRPLSSHLSRKGRRGSSPTPLLDCMIGVTTLESPPTCVCAHECKHARKCACMCAGCCTCGGRPPSEPLCRSRQLH